MFSTAGLALFCMSPALAYTPRAVPRMVRSLSTRKWSTEEKKETGHMAPSNMQQPQLTPEEEKMLTSFREHQSKAARLSMAEEVRTLLDQSIGFGVLSTNSDQFGGYPTGYIP